MNSTEEAPQSAASNLLLSLYALVLTVGLPANGGLLIAASIRAGPRAKSPLLLGLFAADLLVCIVAVPISALLALIASKPWPVAAAWCKMAFFLQNIPVAASTISLMVISVDRYITVKYPRPFGASKQNRHAVTIAALSLWLVAFMMACPLLVAKKVLPKPGGGRCMDAWTNPTYRKLFVVTQVVVVYVVPSVVVLVCYLGVRAQLTALSLTARAAHGELPLPMPLLRRPTHVIIVAGLTNKTDRKIMTYKQGDAEESNSSDCESKLVEPVRKDGAKTQLKMENLQRKRSRKAGEPRPANRSAKEIIQKNRRKFPSDLNGQPVTSTLQSRRRLANALVSVAALFAGCWLPHIICSFWVEFYPLQSQQTRHLSQFSLLLGHAHSAINPVLYWAMNHHSLNQSCAHGSFFANFRLPAIYRNASSTNEAALGPFNPRYTRSPRPQVRRQSSHYLY